MNETYIQDYLRKKNVLYSDNEFRSILGTNQEHHQLREFLQINSHNFYSLDELLNKKCVTSKGFDDLMGEIDYCLQQIDLKPPLKSLLEEIKYFLTESKDCIYFRDCDIKLDLFISSVIEKHDDEEKAYKVVLRCFDELENHGFILNEDSNSMTITEVLKMEVIDYWGGIAWSNATMYFNDLSPLERSQISLYDCIDIIYGYCESI